jgi:hypothetical protein
VGTATKKRRLGETSHHILTTFLGWNRVNCMCPSGPLTICRCLTHPFNRFSLCAPGMTVQLPEIVRTFWNLHIRQKLVYGYSYHVMSYSVSQVVVIVFLPTCHPKISNCTKGAHPSNSPLLPNPSYDHFRSRNHYLLSATMLLLCSQVIIGSDSRLPIAGK